MHSADPTAPEVPMIDVDWPRPSRVHVAVTSRAGGVSTGTYSSLNLALHTGDHPASVHENRRRLQRSAGIRHVQWLQQVHGRDVRRAMLPVAANVPEGDALWTTETDLGCAILTADCLPVLLCDRDASIVAAAHAGWRGLVGGVLTELVSSLPVTAERLSAWLGPAISAPSYEVGDDVREAVIAGHGAAAAGEVLFARPNGRWSFDLYRLARLQLAALGVGSVHGGGYCTLSDARFYSYRRDGETGRMASVVWLAEAGAGTSPSG